MAPPIPPQLLIAGAGALAAYFAFRPGTRLKGRPPSPAKARLPSSIARFAPERRTILKQRQTVDSGIRRFAPEPEAPAPFASRVAALAWADVVGATLQPTDMGVAARRMLDQARESAEQSNNWAILSGAIRTAAAIAAVDGVRNSTGPEGVDAIVFVLCSHDWNWDLSDAEHRKLVGEVFARLWMGPGDEFPANTLTSCTRTYEPEDTPYYNIIGERRPNEDDGRRRQLCRDKLNDINNAWNVLWSHGGPTVAPWPYMERYMRMMVYGRSGLYRGGPAGKPSAPGWAKGFAVAVTTAAAGPGAGAAVALALEE